MQARSDRHPPSWSVGSVRETLLVFAAIPVGCLLLWGSVLVSTFLAPDEGDVSLVDLGLDAVVSTTSVAAVAWAVAHLSRRAAAALALSAAIALLGWFLLLWGLSQPF